MGGQGGSGAIHKVATEDEFRLVDEILSKAFLDDRAAAVTMQWCVCVRLCLCVLSLGICVFVCVCGYGYG